MNLLRNGWTPVLLVALVWMAAQGGLRPVLAQNGEVIQNGEILPEGAIIPQGEIIFGEYPPSIVPMAVPIDRRYDPRSRLWAEAEYLAWWMKGNSLPPLVTSSPFGTPLEESGILGQPGTEILFGGERVDNNFRNGIRVNLGYWLDAPKDRGLEFGFFYLGDGANTGDFQISSRGNPNLSRPFFDVLNERQSAQPVAFADENGPFLAGQVAVDTASEMKSFNLTYRSNLVRGPLGRIDLLGGYRFLRFRESLTITEALESTDRGGAIAVGTTFDIEDRFAVENDFNGGEIGLLAEWEEDNLRLEFLAKVGLGGVHQNLDINGFTVVTTPGSSPTTSVGDGGLLALPSNITGFEEASRDRFAVLPEFSVNLNYQVNSWVDLMCGYSLVYLSDVLRTGDQIDTQQGTAAVNPTQLPNSPVPVTGPLRPERTFADSSIWAQGISIGILIRE